MSKNKLNTEEQAFRNKINDAHFSYNESAWQGVKGQLKGETTPATFSPLLKAAAGLLVITALVFVLQNQYSTSNETNKRVVSNEVVQENNEKTEKAAPTSPTPTKEIEKQEQVTEAIPPLAKETQKKEKYKTNTAKKSPVSVQKEKQQTTDEISSKKEKAAVNAPNEKLSASIQIIGKTCLHQKITLKALIKDEINAFHYRWKINNVVHNNNQNKLEVILNKAEKYSIDLVVINEKGEDIARSQKVFEVTKAAELDFTYEDQTGLFDDFTAVFNVKSNVNNLSWEIDGNPVAIDQNKAINFGNEGIFDVELIHQSGKGCESSIKKPVLISTDYKPLINAFTPNDDGVNDNFMPDGFADFDGEFKLSIYSLDGIKIFESSSPIDPWNGKFKNKGKMMPDGNYIWKIEVRKGEKQRFFSDKVKLLNIK